MGGGGGVIDSSKLRKTEDSLLTFVISSKILKSNTLTALLWQPYFTLNFMAVGLHVTMHVKIIRLEKLKLETIGSTPRQQCCSALLNQVSISCYSRHL